MSEVHDQYVRDISLVLDNEEATSERVRLTVARELRYSAGYPDMSPDDYADAIRGGREHEFYGVVGLAVEEVLQDIIEEEATGTAADLLRELVNGLTYALGSAYTPGTDDYAAAYAEVDQ